MAIDLDNFPAHLFGTLPLGAEMRLSDINGGEDVMAPHVPVKRPVTPGLMPPPPPARWLQKPARESPPGVSIEKKAAPSKSGPETPALGTQACYIVEVSGLAKRLMIKPTLQVIFEQAGFEAEVVEFTVVTVDRVQKVRIKLSSNGAAQRCANHFNGCTWDAGATSARILPREEANHSRHGSVPNQRSHRTKPCNSSKRERARVWECGQILAADHRGGCINSKGYKDAAEHKLPWLPMGGPAYVHSELAESVPVAWHTRVDTSDVSTTVSDEEAHPAHWGAYR